MHTSTTPTSELAPWTAAQLQEATGGHWPINRPEGSLTRILTDSRTVGPGDVFLALKGERFDAHDFVRQVAQQGAAAVIVSRPLDVAIPQLIVPDTRAALGNLGRYRREQYPQLQVIALTGSSGKTTTKEMLGNIFAQLGPTLVTRGNLNNDLGVPMMLLELTPAHRFAIMELGASHVGEIDYTAALVQPQVAGILNIGTAHMGEFGGRTGILQAKSEIYRHIQPGGTAIVPAADEFAPQIQQAAAACRQLGFGEGGEVYASGVQLMPQSSTFVLHTPQGTRPIQLPFAGLHNVHNAEAAAAFALALDADLDAIEQGLANARNAQGRLNFIPHGRFLLIDDSYNANPHSMRAAADVLCQQDGIRVLVMGEIGELGDDSTAEHTALGHDLASRPLDYVVAVGAQAHSVQQGADQTASSRVQCLVAPDHATALTQLQRLTVEHAQQPMTLLFKGSRFTHMEHLLTALMETL